MRSTFSLRPLALALLIGGMTATATAGAATVTIPDNIDMKLGGRLHVLASGSDDESLSDRDELDLQVRRARIRFSSTVDEWITLFLQTEMASQTEKSGADMVLIDANVTLKPMQQAQVVLGQHMSPALRQNVTSSGALLAIDRPGVQYKSLTWGTRALAGFSRKTQSETDAGLRGEVDVRDTGATFFGVASPGERLHLKYYAGIYEGALSAADSRYTARGQINFGDAESGYFNAANYLGKKDTIALGLSVDQQSEVATDLGSGDEVDYLLSSVDFFAAKGALTFEAAYINLDLGGAGLLAFQDGSAVGGNKATGKQAEGDGYYLQAAWQFGKWQPWAGFESWDSNADDGYGSFSGARLGVSYLLNKESSFKLGVENWENDVVADGDDAEFMTVTAGYFITF
ncbi:porin [Agaribacterium haliotis]|uniref:porin n=1 Tax=Agaribacterium haliotis TaxID=2013869 RepID=UPI0013041957|nr:porin [Agaribacterium haliotis]